MYNDLNPKYIELYSKKPPIMAPIILEENATVIDGDLFNSFENANPEKNIGKDITKVIRSLLNNGDEMLDILIDVKNNPDKSVINSKP